ncbi:hypothetical protein IJ182_05560 [bacterium]|nr:hypothetical protein [bacterium]
MDKEPKKPSLTITIMGIGSGGMNIINRISNNFSNNPNINFICINTDTTILNNTSEKKLSIGQKITNGLGCGGNPNNGRLAAEENRNEITKELLGNDIVILISCFGGGTGTGATPVIAKIAKEFDIKTKALVTVPFTFEGKKRGFQAKEGIEKLKEYTDVYSYKNDLILDLLPQNTSMRDAFNVVNEQMSRKIQKLIEEYI